VQQFLAFAILMLVAGQQFIEYKASRQALASAEVWIARRAAGFRAAQHHASLKSGSVSTP
jgi:hypothetical protein